MLDFLFQVSCHWEKIELKFTPLPLPNILPLQIIHSLPLMTFLFVLFDCLFMLPFAYKHLLSLLNRINVKGATTPDYLSPTISHTHTRTIH